MVTGMASLGLHYLAAKFITIAVAAVLNYFGYRHCCLPLALLSSAEATPTRDEADTYLYPSMHTCARRRNPPVRHRRLTLRSSDNPTPTTGTHLGAQRHTRSATKLMDPGDRVAMCLNSPCR
jgi:hypothetical protein